MKGLQEQTETRTKYLVIKHSSICEESKTEREGFSPIEVLNPRTNETVVKFIKRYRSVEALVARIEWYDTADKYETRFQGWKIHLNADGVPCVLDLPFDSRASNRFMKLAENLNFSEPVEFSAWHDVKTDSTAFNVRQHDRSVPQVYTRENPGDCPPPTQNRVGKWNFDAQKDFLYSRMIDVVIPSVEGTGNEMPDGEARTTSATPSFNEPPAQDIEDDEIPF